MHEASYLWLYGIILTHTRQRPNFVDMRAHTWFSVSSSSLAWSISDIKCASYCLVLFLSWAHLFFLFNYSLSRSIYIYLHISSSGRPFQSASSSCLLLQLFDKVSYKICVNIINNGPMSYKVNWTHSKPMTLWQNLKGESIFGFFGHT
jgi:hypothetical protein